MSKRNSVVFSKPDDPKFLKLFKQDSGYKEGPNVNTKRGQFEETDQFQMPHDNDIDDDIIDRLEQDDEKPQVVVLKAGDLTAEQAEAEEKHLQFINEQKPADLNEKIIFKSSRSQKNIQSTQTKAVKTNKKKPANIKLSFEFNDDNEENCDSDN